jgi:hypothetical protein
VDVSEPNRRTAGVERPHSSPVASAELAARRDQHGGLNGLVRGVGNRRVGRVIARMRDGEGLLAGGVVHPDVEAAIAAARGGGRSLDKATRDRLEPRYDTRLSDVRVHTDDAAQAMARAVSARAFTVGNDIFFGRGEHRPGNHDGDQLIAHEVAHVIQQRGAPAAGALIASQPGDALEREAEAMSRDPGR